MKTNFNIEIIENHGKLDKSIIDSKDTQLDSYIKSNFDKMGLPSYTMWSKKYSDDKVQILHQYKDCKKYEYLKKKGIPTVKQFKELCKNCPAFVTMNDGIKSIEFISSFKGSINSAMRYARRKYTPNDHRIYFLIDNIDNNWKYGIHSYDIHMYLCLQYEKNRKHYIGAFDASFRYVYNTDDEFTPWGEVILESLKPTNKICSVRTVWNEY